ncbi:hypothetical protein, partial [Rudaea sp.]|uniref:hypothetical protein n=1 Tax=Rudaea sp. TaxID=2136325 RepID=UPI00321FB3C2
MFSTAIAPASKMAILPTRPAFAHGPKIIPYDLSINIASSRQRDIYSALQQNRLATMTPISFEFFPP